MSNDFFSIRKFLENVNKRHVIIEKYPQLLKDSCFGMTFKLSNSKKKSELIVRFKTSVNSVFPNVKGKMLLEDSGQFIMNFESFDIQICSSADCNSSSEFLKWVECFLNNKPYSGGADISFFNYNNKNTIITLRGCILEGVTICDNMPFVSIKFFSYKIP